MNTEPNAKPSNISVQSASMVLQEEKMSLTFSQLRKALKQFRTSPLARCLATNCIALFITDWEMNTSCHMFAMNKVNFSDSGKSIKKKIRQ